MKDLETDQSSCKHRNSSIPSPGHLNLANLFLQILAHLPSLHPHLEMSGPKRSPVGELYRTPNRRGRKEKYRGQGSKHSTISRGIREGNQKENSP